MSVKLHWRRHPIGRGLAAKEFHLMRGEETLAIITRGHGSWKCLLRLETANKAKIAIMAAMKAITDGRETTPREERIPTRTVAPESARVAESYVPGMWRTKDTWPEL